MMAGEPPGTRPKRGRGRAASATPPTAAALSTGGTPRDPRTPPLLPRFLPVPFPRRSPPPLGSGLGCCARRRRRLRSALHRPRPGEEPAGRERAGAGSGEAPEKLREAAGGAPGLGLAPRCCLRTPCSGPSGAVGAPQASPGHCHSAGRGLRVGRGDSDGENRQGASG